MKWSNYQSEIFNQVSNGTTNIAINAVAGSGKTATIVECCKRLGLSKWEVKFMCFNRSIKSELETRIGRYADVSTLHAFGLTCLKRVSRRIIVDENKYRQTIKNMVPDIDPDKMAICSNIKKIFNLCRVNLIKAGDIESIKAIIDEHDIVLLGDEINCVNTLLVNAYTLNPNSPIVDYTDMIVLPLSYRHLIYTYKYVFIDECQDLNTAQRELMLAAAREGRFIAVGDRRQAINGFAGADCESFDKIANLPNTIELPLSVNYRCGRNIIALAQAIVPQIQAHDGAIEGIVTRINDLTSKTFADGDMVLCRSNAPLVAICLKLIKAGRTAIVKGKDIAEGLDNLIKKSKTKTIAGFVTWSLKEKETLLRDIMRKERLTKAEAEETAKYIGFCDRCDCITTIGENVRSIEGIREHLNKIFTDERIANAITLSSCHKSKGLEADRVIILAPEKLPLYWKGQLEWQAKQEMNLKYVAITRAKKELVICNLPQKSLYEVDLER